MFTLLMPSWENISSFLGDIAQILTVILAAVIAYKQNKIHRQSNTPYCDICCIDYNNEIEIKIKNNGTGVMYIEKFEVLYKKSNLIKYTLYDCIPEDVSLTYYSIDILDKSVAPNGYMTLIKKEPDKKIENYNATQNKDYLDECANLRNCLKKLTIRIIYRDMYNKEYTKEKDLSLIFGIEHRRPKLDTIH